MKIVNKQTQVFVAVLWSLDYFVQSLEPRSHFISKTEKVIHLLMVFNLTNVFQCQFQEHVSKILGTKLTFNDCEKSLSSFRYCEWIGWFPVQILLDALLCLEPQPRWEAHSDLCIEYDKTE